MKTKHLCIVGDSRRMDNVESSSVQLIVTSPPYWQLKDYGSENFAEAAGAAAEKMKNEINIVLGFKKQ